MQTLEASVRDAAVSQNDDGARRGGFVFALAVFLATAFKLYLAATTVRTHNTIFWQKFVVDVQTTGGLGVYYKPYAVTEYFNHPPFVVHFLQFIGWMSDWSGVSTRFLVRLPTIIADVASAVLVWKMSGRGVFGATSSWVFLLFALSPVSVLVSGFHGNTDPIMMMFFLLAIWWAMQNRAPWLVGIAFGMSLNIKIVPLVFVPVFLFALSTPKQRIEYSIAAFLTVFVGGLPYLAQDPIFILRRLFGYNSQYGVWRISRLLDGIAPGGALDSLFRECGKFLLVAAIVGVSWMMNRAAKQRGASFQATGKSAPENDDATLLFGQCAAVAFLFLALTPGFAYQYLVWLVPFTLCLRLPQALWFHAASALYLLSVYTFRWRTVSWYASNPYLSARWGNHIIILETLCWTCVAVLAYSLVKQMLKTSDKSPIEYSL